MEPESLQGSNIIIDPQSENHLHETARWAKFLGITSMVLSGLLILFGIGIESILQSFGSREMFPPTMDLQFLTVFFCIVGFIFFTVSFFLFRFAVRMKMALATRERDHLQESFRNLKLVYRTLAILMIIYLSLIILNIVAVLVIGISR